jgi:hypothetical protein
LAVAGVVCLLALAGLKSALVGPDERPALRPRSSSPDLAVEGFAELFARSYLSWRASSPAAHEQELSAFMSAALESGGGVSLPERGSEQALWTAPVGDQPLGPGQRLVTVAAQTTRRLVYLAVPVSRTAAGLLFVPSYPALVGGPARSAGAQSPEEQPVEDAALRAVVRRALANYLAREPQNLRADLDPRALVSLPPQPLRLTSLDELTRSGPERVGAQVTVTDTEGASLTLRYELAVVLRDRWYVRSIGWRPVSGRPW